MPAKKLKEIKSEIYKDLNTLQQLRTAYEVAGDKLSVVGAKQLSTEIEALETALEDVSKGLLALGQDLHRQLSRHSVETGNDDGEAHSYSESTQLEAVKDVVARRQREGLSCTTPDVLYELEKGGYPFRVPSRTRRIATLSVLISKLKGKEFKRVDGNIRLLKGGGQ